MLNKKVKQQILFTLMIFEGYWTADTLAALPGEWVPAVAIFSELEDLCKSGLVYRTRKGYAITTEGVEFMLDARDPTQRSGDPKKWISNVRAGINSEGRQTRVTNAAIPEHMDTRPNSYEPDLDAAIDLARSMSDD